MAFKSIRKIPATMATQHPDHGAIPFWKPQAFISAAQEVEECYLAFSELGATEYKWDWEGKMVDEAVVDRLFADYFDYFQEHPLGVDKFLTFRLPNPKVETEYRLGRAFMGLMSASTLSKHVGYTHPPLFEVILPMTETADEMIAIQEAYREMASLTHPILKFEESSCKHIELIPLFEQIGTIAQSDKILEQYLKLHKEKFEILPEYLRPYVARSDPALNSGIVPTVLSIKIALSRYRRFEEQHEMPLYPIIGAASLPFRGGLTPFSAPQFIDEYQGVRTTTIQSGFKYDFPKEDVKTAILELEETLPKGKAERITPPEEKQLFSVMKTFENFYTGVIEDIAPMINAVANFLPRRRERVQHVGLFGYSRGVGSVKLPRAIGFTAALYSLGIPPELIGTGRGIAWAKKQGFMEIVETYYHHIREDLTRSGAYLNHDNLRKLTHISDSWEQVMEDVQCIEDYLGFPLGPQTVEEKEHKTITDTILEQINNDVSPEDYIEQAAIVRRSLG